VNALIVNFEGIGDALIELPFLRTIDEVAPHVRYYHTGSPLLEDAAFREALGLRALCGLVPSIWRKFRREDWNDILAFLRANSVDVIINLRTLGPDHDHGYFEFKRTNTADVAFWNFDFSANDNRPVNIRTKIYDLFYRHRLITKRVKRDALRDIIPDRAQSFPPNVGINIHAGNKFKRWPSKKWEELCCELTTSGRMLKVFGGHNASEKYAGARLVAAINNHRNDTASLVSRPDMLSHLAEVRAMQCVVSVDTWTLHAATGLGVGAIGLYIVTSPTMWGADVEHFIALTSAHLPRCENFDKRLGFCRNGYTTCPLITKEGDGIDVEKVFNHVLTNTLL
jgi:ADP-heptose:LPS heptosyltransferase